MERNNVAKARGNPVTLIGTGLKAGAKAPEFTVLDKALNEVNKLLS